MNRTDRHFWDGDRPVEYPCRCHAHGIGHASADDRVGFSVGGHWTFVPLCKDCALGGCDANRPLPRERT